MTPRLVLLTGPAAGEVASIDTEECAIPGFTLRDYWRAPREIALGGDHDDWQGTEATIRSLPGGEAWLVGLVLPAYTGHHVVPANPPSWGMRTEAVDIGPAPNQCRKWRYEAVPDEHFTPARLAILAPEPPALLVERVKAWGGESWECYVAVAGNVVVSGTRANGTGFLATGESWPDAVRAALGEAS